MDENLANLYPELYKELTSGRSLSYRTFFIWVLVSIYQGCTIQDEKMSLSAWMGGEFGGEWIHVYVWLSPFAVHLKLSQHF